MKNQLSILSKRIFFNILLCSSILISGCVAEKGRVYRSNNYGNETKKSNETVTILPFLDMRENDNKNKVAFYYIPLVPFGWQSLQVPEATNRHLNSGIWTNYNPKEDFPKALAQELQSANIFKEAFFSYSKGEGNLYIQGKIISTRYKGKMFSYGLSMYGGIFWFLGAPASNVTNELEIELSVTKTKTDEVLFSKKYIAPMYKKLSWIYSLKSDFQYPTMLSGIYKQFIEDYKNQIKPSNPQPEKPKTQETNTPPTKSKADRLRELKIMFDEKLITPADYEKEKKKILDSD